MLKSIAIRELLLLVLIVALFLAWRSAVPAAHQLKKLQMETGHIRQESDDVIYVRQLDADNPSQWKFRILVPEGANYEYVWSYDLGNRKPVSTPRRVPCTERQLNLSIHSFDFETSTGRVIRYLSYSGNSSQDCPFGAEHGLLAVLQTPANSKFSPHFAATYEYDSGLHEYQLGEFIKLLRLEGKHPDTNEEIWIELNIKPAEK